MEESPFSEEAERRRALMEAIFRGHWTSVHRYISNKVRQPEVADDLTSLVFLKAYRWLLEDRGMSQVRNWLYATARTTIADYWQEQQKSSTFPLEGLLGPKTKFTTLSPRSSFARDTRRRNRVRQA